MCNTLKISPTDAFVMEEEEETTETPAQVVMGMMMMMEVRSLMIMIAAVVDQHAWIIWQSGFSDLYSYCIVSEAYAHKTATHGCSLSLL